jgi:hypothetical protein
MMRIGCYADAILVGLGRRRDPRDRKELFRQSILRVRQFRHGRKTNLVDQTFTPEGLVKAFQSEQGADIPPFYDRDNIAISDYESSLKHDTRLLRESKGTPKNVNIYGYLFDIDTETSTLLVEDRATSS